MSHVILGETLNFDGTVRVGSSLVRLYRKDTGAYVDSTTSDADAKWSISVGAVAEPFKYFALGWNSQMDAGIGDIRKMYHTVTYHLHPALVDNGSDLIKVDIPDVVQTRVVQLILSSPQNAPDNGQVSIFGQAGGVGDSIDVTVTAGSNYFSQTGNISTSDYFYIRSVTGCGMHNTTLIVMYDYPDQQPPF